MKLLNTLSSDEMLPVHNVVLNLQNAILQSKDVVVKSKQLPTPDGPRFEAVNETKVVEKGMGFYSRTPAGRTSAYNRILNCEISDLEKQTLQEILDTVKRCEEQVKEFWEEQ